MNGSNALERLNLMDRSRDEMRDLLAYLSEYAPEAVHRAIDAMGKEDR